MLWVEVTGSPMRRAEKRRANLTEIGTSVEARIGYNWFSSSSAIIPLADERCRHRTHARFAAEFYSLSGTARHGHVESPPRLVQSNDRVPPSSIHVRRTSLREDLERIPADRWIAHFVKENYDGDWSGAALRGPADVTHPIQQLFANPGTENWAARCG